MGYTTDFEGSIIVRPQLSKEFLDDFNLIADGRNNTYGDGSPDSFDGTLYRLSMEHKIYPNNIKSLVPSCWCLWKLRNEGDITHIEWSGGEKFYDYISWLQFVVDYILERHPGVEFEFGGKINWQGEAMWDTGQITLSMLTQRWSVITVSNFIPKEKMLYVSLTNWLQNPSIMDQVGNLFNKPYAICLLQKDSNTSQWFLSKMNKTINLKIDYLIKTVYNTSIHPIPHPGPPSLLDLCVSFVANQNLQPTLVPLDIKEKLFSCRRCSGCGCKFFGRGYFVTFSTLDGGGYGTLPIGLFCSIRCYDKDAIIVGGPDLTFYPNL